MEHVSEKKISLSEDERKGKGGVDKDGIKTASRCR